MNLPYLTESCKLYGTFFACNLNIDCLKKIRKNCYTIRLCSIYTRLQVKWIGNEAALVFLFEWCYDWENVDQSDSTTCYCQVMTFEARFQLTASQNPDIYTLIQTSNYFLVMIRYLFHTHRNRPLLLNFQ